MTGPRTFPLVVFALALTAACGEEKITTEPPVTWRIEAVNSSQTGTVGTQAEDVTFRVTNSAGTPSAGVAVWISTVQGEASIEVLGGGARGSGEGVTLQDITDAQGIAGVHLQLGYSAGVYLLRAETTLHGDSIAEAFVVAVPDAPERVLLSGTAQVGDAGALLPVPLGVIVSDRYGNAIADVPIMWSVFSGGGTLGSDLVLTNATGGAYVQWTLGSVTGTQEVTATVSDVGNFLFTATAR